MRYKLIALIVIIVGILSFAACDKKSETAVISQKTKTTVSGQTVKSGETNKSTTTNNGTTNNKATTNKDGVSLIAKSNNNYSSSEKKQIADNLQEEIDSLINSIDSLDNGNESDLTIE